MSLTPIDIRNSQFNTTMRGYNRDEVDDYLQNTADALEDSLRERAELQESISKLQKRHDKLAEIEDTLKATLIDAKQTANSILQRAQEDARKIINDAQSVADRLEEKARLRVEQMRQQVADISEVRDEYRKKLGDTISSHLNILQELTEVNPDFSDVDLLSEIKEEYLAESHEIAENVSDNGSTPNSEPETVETSAEPEEELDSKLDDDLDDEVYEDEEDSAVEPLIDTRPIDQSQLETTRRTDARESTAQTSSAIAEAVRAAEIRQPQLTDTRAEQEALATHNDSVDDSDDPALYRKLSAERTHTDHQTDHHTDQRKQEQIQEPKQGQVKAETQPAPLTAPQRRTSNGELTGPDGIVVFGRREDREKALEENVRVLTGLDSVVDQFAEQLGEVEGK